MTKELYNTQKTLLHFEKLCSYSTTLLDYYSIANAKLES
jgi:hypothetical protein